MGINFPFNYMEPINPIKSKPRFIIENNRSENTERYFTEVECDSNLLKDRFPYLYDQIDPILNPGLNRDTLTYGSTRLVVWKCNESKCGHHVWKCTPTQRTNKRKQKLKCTFCFGNSHCPCNYFNNRFPELMKEYDYERNKNIDHTKLLITDLKVWWKCSKSECDHHIWETTTRLRAQGSGCHFCARQKQCPCMFMVNKYPDLMKEYDYDKNKDIDHTTLPATYGGKIWWKCPKSECNHHKWETTIRERLNGTNCPFCSHRNTCPCDYIINARPDLANDICEELNPGLDKSSLSIYYSGEIVWKCSKAKCCHHIWIAKVNYRVRENVGCPFCTGRRSCKCTSVAETHPEIMLDFRQENNPDIDMYAISKGSDTNILWQCHKCDTKWFAVLYARTGPNKTGCPKCNESKLEKECAHILTLVGISFETQKKFDDCKFKDNLKYDFYSKEHKLLIEVDGKQHFEVSFFHGEGDFEKQILRDTIKTKYCQNNKLSLLRISYSEIDNIKGIIISFLDELKNKNHLIKFVGKEYNDRYYKLHQ